MRIKILLITLSLVPFVAKGQTTHKTTFYNKGKMYVGSTLDAAGNPVAPDKYDESYVKLYIVGSANFADGSNVATEESSHLGLTGDITSSISGAKANHVFTSYVAANDSTSGAKGYLYFLNDTKANIVVPTIANPAGDSWNLGWNQKQTISMVSTDVEKHFIALPAIRTGKDNSTNKGVYVAFDPKVAVALHKASSVANTNKGGAQASYGSLISIEAKYSNTEQRRIDVPIIMGSVNKTADLAHNMSDASFAGMSSIMHDIKLYDPTITTAGVAGSNVVDDAVPSDKTFVLTGFTPLGSKSLYSDHMMFNILTHPTARGITDGIGAPISNPKYEMKPGYGYLIAQDVIPDGSYYDDVETEVPANNGGHNVSRTKRAIGGYMFERNSILGTAGRNFNLFPTSAINTVYGNAGSEAYMEGVIKENTDVQVQLMAGYNYLANPFLGVLDLRDLITSNTKQTLADWGNITVGPDATSDIRNKYWIISNSLIKYVMKDGSPKLGFKLSYYDSSSGGSGGVLGTNTDVSDLKDGFVGPMQMFCIQSSGNKTITLPASKVTFKNDIPTTKSVSSRVDELLLQSEVLNDNDDVVFEDRLCLVLRNDGSLASNDLADSRKTLINTSGELRGTETGIKKSSTEETTTGSPYSGILYTKSGEGLPMLTNVIPSSIEQMALYFIPTEKEQRVRIKPFRTETWNDIQQAWLYDKYEDKLVELTSDADYTFTSKPLSEDLAKENRFVIYFNEKPSTDGDIIVKEDPISCYYNGSILYVDGLNENDLNSSLQIYDLQGRLMAKTTITNVPSMTYPKPLNMGTYIVKITGKRSYTTKIVTLQN